MVFPWEISIRVETCGSARKQKCGLSTYKIFYLFWSLSAFDPTVREWLDKWLANEKSAVSGATLTRYRQVVADFLDGLGPVANQRLEAVTSGHVLKHREQLESEGRAPATVNFTVKRVLKRAFKVAIDDGIITHRTLRRYRRRLGKKR